MIYAVNYHARFCNENNRKRHGFKTSQWQVFENVFGGKPLGSIHFCFFQACIQMDIDTCNHGKERITFFTANLHVMQMIIIEDSIIYPLRTCAVIVSLFVFFCASRYGSIKTDIPIRFGIKTTPVGGRGAGHIAGTLFLFPTGDRATPFTIMAFWTIAPVNHA